MSHEATKPRSHERADPADLIGKLGLPGTDRGHCIAAALESVTDPEIPVLTVLDMGMIAGVRVNEAGVEVDLTPTFAGCPALDLIRSDITKALTAAGENKVFVRTVFDPPWTSDRITDEGRRKLKEFGLAPPLRPPGGLPHQQHGDDAGAGLVPLTVGLRPVGAAHMEWSGLEHVACPYCDSVHTRLESMFGPTLCRSIHYCHACRQSFEHFKNV